MTSSFEDILALSNEKTIQQQNLESLLKTYMFVNRLSPPIKNDVFVMLCAIWYHLHNSKNVKKTHGRVLLLVKLQASACNFTKSNTPPSVFFMFFKLYKWYQIVQSVSFIIPENP